MLGASVITRGGLEQGFSWAAQWRCESLQMYLAPSRTWVMTELTPLQIEVFRLAHEKSGKLPIIAHSSLLLNLASPDDNVRANSLTHLIAEMRRALQLGVSEIVLHPGSHPDPTRGMEYIVLGVSRALEAIPKVRILLETSAGQGNSLGSSFEQLAEMLNTINSPHSRLGVCFDTCHVFAAGYDLRRYSDLANTLHLFDKLIGLDRLRCFHLNDSKKPLGSRVDRHAESVGSGEIGLVPFHGLLTDSRFRSIPFIVEPPNGEIATAPIIQALKCLRERNDAIELAVPTLFG